MKHIKGKVKLLECSDGIILDSENNHIVDVRSYGRLKDDTEHDKLSEWIVEAINEKKERESKPFRGIATIGHIDHGKTTIAQGLLEAMDWADKKILIVDDNDFMERNDIVETSKPEIVYPITLLPKAEPIKFNLKDRPKHSKKKGRGKMK